MLQAFARGRYARSRSATASSGSSN
jgi:hypothetical protein